MQPPCFLRFVPRESKSLTAFTKQFGLRTTYLKDMLSGGRQEHNHWQLLETTRWLMHEKTGEYVIVVGKPKYFIDHVARTRGDMPFNLRNFEQLLAGDYCNGDGFQLAVYKQWRAMPRGFQPPKVATLGDGASLAGIFAATPASAQQV